MRIAAIDCGSNSFHLLIADIGAHDQLESIEDDKTLLYLGAEVASTGEISSSSLLRARRVMRHYRNLIERHNGDIVSCLATSAIRSAKNGDQIIEALSKTLNHKVRVISGDEEAQIIFRAISAISTLPETRVLACDMGGGSLELMAGQRDGLEHAKSVGLGASRVARELNVNDPLNSSDIKSIEKKCDDYFKDFSQSYPAGLFSHIVVSSGTLTSLVTMARAKVDGHVSPPLSIATTTKDEILSICDDLVNSTPKERRSILGYDSDRDEFLPTAAIIARKIASLASNDATWLISPYALREGIVLTISDKKFESSGSKSEIAKASIDALAKRMISSANDPKLEQHCKQVNKFALEMFDATKALHGLKKSDRALLSNASLIHDIGETISHSKHDQHGAYILSSIALAGFSPEEAILLRGLIRWHRSRNPKKNDRFVGPISDEELLKAKWLTALLRISDGLDSGKSSAVDSISISINPDAIFIRLHSKRDVELEIYSARRKRTLLEEVSLRDVIIQQAL